MSKLQVPNFTLSALHLAHICSLETWQGINYSSGKKFDEQLILYNSESKSTSTKEVRLSDEYFLHRCATQLHHLLKPNAFINTYPLNDSFIDKFRKVAGIRGAQRRGPTPDIANGLTYLKRTVKTDYRDYKKVPLSSSKYVGSLVLINNLSIAFTVQTNQIPASNHLMLSTRLLFFVMPDVLIFNYSPEIAKKLKLSGDTKKDIKDYYDLLWDGFNRNWDLLKNFEMPPATCLDEKLWDLTKDAGWWQRRVYDLALKQYSSAVPINISDRVKSRFYKLPQIMI